MMVSFIFGFPLAGRLTYRGVSPRIVLSAGFSASLLWFSAIVQPTLSIADLVAPSSCKASGWPSRS